MQPRLLEKYRNDVVPVLSERFGYTNCLSIPKVEKIVVSMGIGDAHSEKAKLETAQKQLALIVGQSPIVTKAKMSVSNFKLREGMSVGLKVTLRGARMYEFLDRMISLAIPRVKDFRGLNASSFDGRGNYNMGFTEQSVFPEIDPSSVTFTQGMNVAIQTSARSDEEARELLTLMGMPFRRD
ncbi:MAG: 50S ribosomal protein L5 [Planctomycetes bacterium]|nr:50S ribosomal protein L5 [Planctomycetota bacterium]